MKNKYIKIPFLVFSGLYIIFIQTWLLIFFFCSALQRLASYSFLSPLPADTDRKNGTEEFPEIGITIMVG